MFRCGGVSAAFFYFRRIRIPPLDCRTNILRRPFSAGFHCKNQRTLSIFAKKEFLFF